MKDFFNVVLRKRMISRGIRSRGNPRSRAAHREKGTGTLEQGRKEKRSNVGEISGGKTSRNN